MLHFFLFQCDASYIVAATAEQTSLLICSNFSFQFLVIKEKTKMEQKFEDVELSSLEEKVDLETLVLYPSELYISEEVEEENFKIKHEQLKNEISNDYSETAIPNHRYEKFPTEFSTNNKEPKFKDLFCFQCSLQFGEKSVYDLHLSLVHGIKGQLISKLTNFCPSI
jgi:hypothetical protein